MKCPACQRENRDTATFCSNCGAPLRPEGEPAEPFELGGRQPEPVPGEEPDVAPSAEEVPDERRLGRPTIRLRREELEEGAEESEGADEAAPLPPGPRSVGDVVADRFEIVEVLESTPEATRYRARDWSRCATCGYDDNRRGDRFCLDCGASLAQPAWATLVEIERRPPDDYDLALSEHGREYYVTFDAEAAPEAAGEPEGGPLVLRWACASDAGQQREHNEDYVDCWSFSHGRGRLLGLFVVADGLGGQDAGEVASRMATEAVWEELRESVWDAVVRGEEPEEDEVERAVERAVQQANLAVYEARVRAHSDMSTTLTLALVVGRTAYIANVGDSRAYWFGPEGLEQVTRDHSLVQRLVDAGQITREQVYGHPQRNLIYQSIGDRKEAQVDLFSREFRPDGRLLLCSDGLWEMVRDEGIEEALMAEADPQRVCDLLVRRANMAGGEDNISVIVAQLSPV